MSVHHQLTGESKHGMEHRPRQSTECEDGYVDHQAHHQGHLQPHPHKLVLPRAKGLAAASAHRTCREEGPE